MYLKGQFLDEEVGLLMLVFYSNLRMISPYINTSILIYLEPHIASIYVNP